MGNEITKETEQAQPDGKIHGKCENGVNGISLTITANGYTVDVPTKIPIENNEELPSPEEEVKTESTEYAVLESHTGPTEAEPLVPNPEPSEHSEEVPPREEKISLFSKMFKKKTAPTAEKDKQEEISEEGAERKPDNDQQLPNGKIHEKQENGTKNGMAADDPGIQVPPLVIMEPNVQTESTEYVVLESQTGPTEAEAEPLVPKPDPSSHSEEVPPREERVSLFSKMFKKKTAPTAEKEAEKPKEEETDVSADTDQQKEKGENHEEQRSDICNSPGPPSAVEVKTESTEYVVLESQTGPTEAEAPVPAPDPSDHSEEVPPREERVSLFSKMFKKKTAPAPAAEKKTAPETEKHKEPEGRTEKTSEEKKEGGPSATDQDQDTGCVDSELEKVVEEESCPKQEEESEVDTGSGNIVEEKQDSPQEENPVMNFFKTLVTPTKTSKKEAPPSDVSKAQVAQVSDPPAAPKGMPAPPPPPPEPPRAEPAAKKPEEPKAAAKDSPKGKSAKDTLTRLFRSKKPDASKASTLEAAAKPAPAPAVAKEEKKPEAKKSLLSFFKPKALLDTVSSTVQAASTSGVQLFRKTTAAVFVEQTTEPKAAPATAAAELGPSKEEAPKAAKSTEATVEAKTTTAAPSGGEEAASAPKKLEKRNSITLFFKNLSQKRPSTDAGAPTEAPAPSAEKAK